MDITHNSLANDLIIDRFLEKLKIRSFDFSNSLKIHAFVTVFFTSLINRGIESISRWTRHLNFNLYDVLFIPIHTPPPNQNSIGHWSLVGVFLKQNKIILFDPMGFRNDRALVAISQYLDWEFGRNRIKVKDWEIIKILPGLPTQKNAIDCGFYILYFAEQISMGIKPTNIKLTLSSVDLRKSIARTLRSNLPPLANLKRKRCCLFEGCGEEFDEAELKSKLNKAMFIFRNEYNFTFRTFFQYDS